MYIVVLLLLPLLLSECRGSLGITWSNPLFSSERRLTQREKERAVALIIPGVGVK